MFNESQRKTDLDRREFLSRSTQAVAGAVVVSNLTPAFSAEADQVPAKPETARAANKYTPRFRPLKINHDRARAEFAELIKAIPKAERWKSPFPPEAKNGWKSLKEAESKRVEFSTFFQDPDPLKNEAELDRVELAGEERIPWPKEQDWALLQRWVAANREYANLIEKIIEQSDYLSEFENQDLCYYEEPLELSEVQTFRNVVIFLRRWTLCLIRSEEWDAAKKSLATMRLLLQKNAGTKGHVFHAMIRSAMAGMVREMAISMLKQHRVTLKQGEQVWEFIRSLRELQPTLVLEQRLEYQNYYPNLLAQIPLLKNIRDQIPALSLMGFIDKPGVDVVFAPQKLHESSKFDDVLNPERTQDLSVDTGLIRVLPCLINHPAPFDKAKTVAWAWQGIKDSLAEYRPHEYPNRTMKWHPPEYFAEYDRLHVGSDSYLKKLMESLEHSDESLPELPPFTEDVVAELRQSFAKQENPLGRLFVASQLASVSFIAYSIYFERKDAVELCAACWLFEKRHQRRPQKLEELVDERLFERIPISAHTGEPFGYDAKRGLIWRRGESGTPDGKPPKDELFEGLSEAEIARDYYPMLGIYPLISTT